MEPSIQDIENNYETIIQIVGKQSFVNWEAFTKSTSDLNNKIDKLSQELSKLKAIQQRRFITKMKELKSLDIPDLIKTVQSKKLPKEALKTIVKNFIKTEQLNLKLKHQTSQLKQKSQELSQQYINYNKVLSLKMEQVSVLIQQKIKQTGLQEIKPVLQPILDLKFNFDIQKLQQIRKSIQIQQIPSTDHLISLQTYSHIVNHTHTIVKDQYRQITFAYRKRQRQLIEKPQKYIETLIQYMTNTQNLILEGQKAIVKYIGLTTDKVSQSENHMIDKGLAQSLLFLQTGVRTKVKQSIQSTNQVQLSTTKTIIQYQITMITQKHHFLKQILSYLQKTPENFQIIPVVIGLALNDFVYFKFQLEEEDFMKAINDQLLLSNSQIAGLFKQMETKILFLMKDANVITEDMLKVMLYQSEQIQNQLNQIGLGKGLGGIFPGSTPQDILKQQQKAQLEKMKKEK